RRVRRHPVDSRRRRHHLGGPRLLRSIMHRIKLPLVASLLVLAAARDAATEPKPTRPKLVTQADIDRLEKKIAEQQHLLERLVRLQQQYLQSLVALVPDTGASAPSIVEPEPKVAVVDPKPEAKTTTAPKPEPAKVVVKPKKQSGKGTIVGKVKGGDGDVDVYLAAIAPTAAATASTT